MKNLKLLLDNFNSLQKYSLFMFQQYGCYEVNIESLSLYIQVYIYKRKNQNDKRRRKFCSRRGSFNMSGYIEASSTESQVVLLSLACNCFKTERLSQMGQIHERILSTVAFGRSYTQEHPVQFQYKYSYTLKIRK